MADPVEIDVYGLKDFAADLGRAEFALTLKEKIAAAEVARGIASEARAAAIALGSVAAKSAADITSKGANVAYGGSGYNLGAEFGAIKWHQFDPWLGSGEDSGYFLFPTVRQWRTRKAVEIYGKHIGEALRLAFNSPSL